MDRSLLEGDPHAIIEGMAIEPTQWVQTKATFIAALNTPRDKEASQVNRRC